MSEEMVNPFAPPVAASELPRFASTSDDELARRILEERESPRSRWDFSAIIGSRFRRKLQGVEADRLVDSGLVPEVYQGIRWWCLLFIPLVPIGTCAVADYKQIDRPFSDDHSRSFPVAMDWFQTGVHVMIGLSVLLAIVCTISWALLAR